MKQRIVIRARSIKIGEDSENVGEFPVSTKSVFSDGYDYEGEKERLHNLLESDEFLPPAHSEYAAVKNFYLHQSVLQQYIYRNHTNPRYRRRNYPENIRVDDYQIFTSENENFNSLGRLTDTSQDSVHLHTKQAVRLWMGVNTKNKDNKGYNRWPGIRYAMGLFGELVNAAQTDNPFALASLLIYEKKLNDILAYLENENTQMQKQLDESAESGINISVAATPNPTEFPVGTVRGYGFKLLKLLTVYDMFVRLVTTLTLKGLVKNRDGHNKIREGGRHYRDMAQDLYRTVMRIRSAENTKRSVFLADDEDMGNKMQIAVLNGFLDPLTEDVLNFKATPEFAYIRPLYGPAELEKICAYAHKYDLYGPAGQTEEDQESV